MANSSVIEKDVLSPIGNSDLMQLQTVVPPDSQIYLKCERQNRTGSMKDRMADAMLGSAGSDGLLPSGGTVVVYTGLKYRSSVKIY